MIQLQEFIFDVKVYFLPTRAAWRRAAGRLLSVLVCVAIVVAVSSPARANTWQAPVGGKPVRLGENQVGCGSPGGGWVYDEAARSLRPPADSAAVGTAVDLKVAPSAAACAASVTSLKLVTTGPWPTLDKSSVVFAPDQGRLELSGHHLAGVIVVWRSNTASGTDACQAPQVEGGAERCTWSLARGSSSASPTSLSWLPAGSRSGADVSTFDADGHLAAASTFALVPTRVNLASLLPPDASIDLSSGKGEVSVAHADMVAGVDCGDVRCELIGDQLTVRTLSGDVSSVNVKFKLVPHAFVAKGGGFDAAPVARLSVVHCPLSVLSGPPLRHVEAGRMVVRIEGRCATEAPALRFLVGDSPLEVLDIVADADGADVLLRTGDIDADVLSIVAVHKEAPELTLAVVRVPTAAAPDIKASLEIAGYRNLAFIPNNRAALVHTSVLPDHARLVPLPIPGVYRVDERSGVFTITGDPNASGQTAMKFGYRNDALPEKLAAVDLAILISPLQRAIHEANLTAPFGQSATGPRPLAELVCGPGPAGTRRVLPGAPSHLPFAMRDDCRIIFHRERLRPEFGTQRMTLDIEVVDADGSSRGDARVSSTIVLRAGSEPLYAWIHGVRQPFDRVIVRLSHLADEAHYINALEVQTGVPEVKWAAVFGTGHVRLYATTAIPTGLYRFGDAHHSGVLTLNFGVLSRLTWLGSEGHEGFLGAEAGIMAIGLANSTGDTGQPLTQVGAVAGLGISVPIANRSSPTQASLNLHGWFEESLAQSASDHARRSAFIFGPSLSIGNVGTNL